MSWKYVVPVIDPAVRNLCFKPYPNHNKGCPNYGKKIGCPPQAPLVGDIINLSKQVWVIWNEFDFGGHCARMKEKHPMWSQRQIECCLYWQGTARKQLKQILTKFTSKHPGLKIIQCPEACGVNLTATMDNAGIELQWPPTTKTYQIVLAGYGR